MAYTKKKKPIKSNKIITDSKGKKYRDLGGGKSEGVSTKKPSMVKVKKSPAYSSKKRKVTKRKYSGKIK